MNAAQHILLNGIERAGETSIALTGPGFSLSYADLLSGIQLAANFLIRAGVGRGSLVLISHNDGPLLVKYVLACMAIGAIAAPINPRLPAIDLQFIVEDSRADFLLLDDASLELHEAFLSATTNCSYKLLLSNLFSDEIGADGSRGTCPLSLSFENCDGDEPAFCIYSSGTTGRPKGIVHAHRNVLDSLAYLRDFLGVEVGQKIFCTSKLFFAYSLGLSIFGSLQLGATTILGTEWPTAPTIIHMLDTFRPDYVFSVPKMFQLMLEHGIHRSTWARSIRAYISAGEKLPIRIASDWTAATGIDVLDSYGTSESVYMILANTRTSYRLGTAGLPCPNVIVELRAPEQASNSTSGFAFINEGVLWFRSRSCLLGYTNSDWNSRHDLASGWICTGDIFRRDSDGFYEFIGRQDDVFKRYGRWVSPTEIENAVTHKAVAEAALVGQANPHGLLDLVLFVVLKTDGVDRGIVGQDILSGLELKFPPHKVPHKIVFLSELPRGPTGKIQRYKLRSIEPGTNTVCIR
jgi:acyl-coenzyme A synthetase/AMP-(fatty) acid ligase